jgi:hypothetical protein
MVRDNVTGLIWEVKQDKDGTPDYANPHDADNIYTWYNSNSETNGGDSGYAWGMYFYNCDDGTGPKNISLYVAEFAEACPEFLKIQMETTSATYATISPISRGILIMTGRLI